MTDTTVFQENDGVTDGRIQPTGWQAPDGSWVICLGSDTPNVTGRLKVGDATQVAQTAAFNDAILHLRARTRGPETVPDGCWWEAWLNITWASGAHLARVVHRLDPEETIDFSDLGWEVPSGTTGTITFLLILQGVANLVVTDAELPAFYIDDLSFSPASSASLRLYNRFPEPNGTGARADATISFDAFPSSANLTVTVNGVTAYAGGSFTAPFLGPASATSTTTGGSLRFVIDPLAIWGNEEIVSVVVTDGTTTIPWAFTAERTTGPEIASVVAQGYKQVRVTYDEPATAVSATGAGDALNPASYSITRTPGVVSVQPTITGVTQVSSTEFDLAVDLELSPGAPYTLTLEGVTDLLGNATEPWSPGAVAVFTGWMPPVPVGRDFDLYSFFSDQTRTDDASGELRNFIACLQDCVGLLLYEIDSFADITDPNLAPEQYVDAMLADLGNPFPFALTLTQKRLLVQLLLPIYEQKGTAPGIANAIRLFTGIECEIVSVGWGSSLDGVTDTLGDSSMPGWPLGAGQSFFILGSTVGIDPFSFWVQVIGTSQPTAAQTATIAQIVAYMQRGECHYLGFAPQVIPVVESPVILDGPGGSDSMLGDAGAFPGSFVLH